MPLFSIRHVIAPVVYLHLLCVGLAFAERPGAEKKIDNSMRVRLREDMGSLDWTVGNVNGPVVQHIMEGLTRTNAKGDPVAGIARKWSRQGNTWTFQLKKGVKWSDGQDVCAAHFVDGLTRVLSPGVSSYSFYYFDIVGAKELNQKKARTLKGVEAKNCTTLKIQTTRPITYLPSVLAHWTALPVRKDLIDKHGAKWDRPENLAVNGPYVIQEWNINQKTVLVPNFNYHGTPPKFDRIEFLYVTDDATALSLFDNMRVDIMTDVPFQDMERLQKRPEFKSFPAFIGYYLGFNIKDKNLDKKNLRRALSLALDREEIPKFLHGQEQPARGWVPDGLLHKPSLKKSKYLKFDPDKAKKELALSKFSTKKTLDLYYYTKQTHTPLMEWVQAQWKENLGIKVKLHPVEGKIYWSRVALKKYPIFLSGTSGFIAHPFAFLNELKSDSHANWTNWKSTKYDKLTQAIAIENNSVKRTKMVLEAETELLHNDAAIVPLYFRPSAVMLHGEAAADFWINPLNYFSVR